MAVLSATDSLRLLADAGRILADHPGYESALPALTRLLVPGLADWCSLHLKLEDGEIRRFSSDHPDSEAVRLVSELHALVPNGHDGNGGGSEAFRTGAAVLIPDLREMHPELEKRTPEHLDLLRTLDFRSSILVPLAVRGRILGMLTLVQSGTGRRFDADDLSLASELGTRIGLAVHNDILLRESRRVEEAHRKSETLYRAVTENSPQLTWMSDDSGNPLFYNRQWSEYTGRPIRPRDTATNMEVVHPDDVPVIHEIRRRAIPAGEPYSFEFRVRRADGAWRWHLCRVVPVKDPEGRMECWFGSATDVHELRLVQESLRQSEDEFRVMFELAGSGKMQLDPATGRFLRVNRKFCGIVGRAGEELLAMSYPELVFADSRAGIEALLAEIRGGKRRDWYEETRLVRKDGTLRWVQVTGTVLSGQPGRPERLLATVHDVTERKLAEEEARSAQEKFRQSQKLESIGRLAGGVAHDFNNLLTAINGYSDLLLPRMDPASVEAGYVKEIRQSGERAAVLTRQLLAYSRRQMMSLKVTDLNEVVARMANMLRRLLGEPIRLDTRLDPALPRVKVDAGQFEQVILNLAINARDAMPDGGVLTLRTAQNRLVAPVEAHEATIPAGAYALLEVEDTGHGMEKDVLARLFEPFFTTKEVGKGTGLGLSMVQGIVRQSEGFIRVESAPKAGTRFTILLPAVEARAEAPSGESVATALPGPAGDGATVLLVEDEDAVRRYAGEILSRSGYRVLEAGGGEEALQIAERHAGPIHLLLTDVVMPGMTGPRLSEALAAARPGMRVLFMSGYSDTSILRYGILDANRDFLQKPFSPADLLSKAREILVRQAA